MFRALRLDVPIRHVEVAGRLPDSSFGIQTAMWPFLDIKYAELHGWKWLVEEGWYETK
jgi:hypothetical protein